MSVTERDMVNTDGTLNRRVIRRIARIRAKADTELDVIDRAGIATPRMPMSAFRQWRRTTAAKIDKTGLRLTPFADLFARRLAEAESTARTLKVARDGERLLARERAAEVPNLPRIVLVGQLLASVRAAQ